MTRPDGRSPADLRPVTIEPGFVRTATGSALIACGGTRVIPSGCSSDLRYQRMARLVRTRSLASAVEA